MMESRACYGYYGEGHGATGEAVPKKQHPSGYSFDDYVFEVKGVGRYVYPICKVKAMDYDHAVAQMKRWGKREGFEVVKCIGKNV